MGKIKMPPNMVQITRNTKTGREIKIIPLNSWKIMDNRQGWELVGEMPQEKAQIPLEVQEFIKEKAADVPKEEGIAEIKEVGFPELLEISIANLKKMTLTKQQLKWLKANDERKSVQSL